MYQTGSYSESQYILTFKVLYNKNLLSLSRSNNNIWGTVKNSYLRVSDETPAL